MDPGGSFALEISISNSRFQREITIVRLNEASMTSRKTALLGSELLEFETGIKPAASFGS
jgi:hypothetical protein